MNGFVHPHSAPTTRNESNVASAPRSPDIVLRSAGSEPFNAFHWWKCLDMDLVERSDRCGNMPSRWLRQSMTAMALAAIALVSARWEPVSGAISGASVAPASLDAGATGTAAVAFTTGLGVPIGGSITIVFPPTFFIDGTVAGLTNPVGIDPTSSLVVGSNLYTVVVTVTGTAVAAGTAVSFTISGVSNPGNGLTSNYGIRTADSTGGTIESTTNIAGSNISKTTFTSSSLVLSTPNAGSQVQITISFQTSVNLRVGSQIELQFPSLPGSTFIISGATVTNRIGLDPSCSILVNSIPYLQLGVTGSGVNALTAVSLTFDGIYNPAAQTLGTFAVRTRHSYGGILQEVTGLTAQDANGGAIAAIQSTALSSTATVTPLTYFAGMPTTFSVRFPNAAFLVTGARISVTFPARFDISGATLGGVSNMPSTGTSLAMVGATTIQVTLGTGTVPVGQNRGFSIASVVNPGSSCGEYIYEYCLVTWENYAIVTTDSIGQVYEQSTTVPGTPIVKKPMLYARVRPLLKVPSILTSAVVNFTTQATIPLGGKIEVVFPTGYQLGAVAVSGQVNIPTSSVAVVVSGLQISLTVAGSSIPPTGQLTATFSAITTPQSSATGMYILRTRDAAGYIIEEHNKINGEGCLYLNSCNGHGTCTLFSSTCICDPGWGAATDNSPYRSPDCSLRTCPSGKSWNNLPTDSTTSHDVMEECSGMGVCDRSTGKCICVDGFAGSACQRLTCPNNCRNRGKCVTMRELATMKTALPISTPTTYSGSTDTWDENRILGCACDSGWAVGTESGEIQVTEYFGGDCSLRHCPTGNDPDTVADETDCSGVPATGGFLIGNPGNICHVECSNRGICNYRRGICQCFAGYSGFACQIADSMST